ncbi:MAG TPA: hypothetical protein VKS60_07645 [Stellaceae bacterium]|nr:hypothetical protein [Stellaceae bacterium]
MSGDQAAEPAITSRSSEKRLLAILGICAVVVGLAFGAGIGMSVSRGATTSTIVTTILTGVSFAMTLLNFTLRLRKLI